MHHLGICLFTGGRLTTEPSRTAELGDSTSSNAHRRTRRYVFGVFVGFSKVFSVLRYAKFSFSILFVCVCATLTFFEYVGSYSLFFRLLLSFILAVF